MLFLGILLLCGSTSVHVFWAIWELIRFHYDNGDIEHSILFAWYYGAIIGFMAGAGLNNVWTKKWIYVSIVDCNWLDTFAHIRYCIYSIFPESSCSSVACFTYYIYAPNFICILLEYWLVLFTESYTQRYYNMQVIIQHHNFDVV